MVHVELHCPNCDANVPHSALKQEHLYFTNVKCPGCNEWVDRSHLRRVLKPRGVHWSGFVGGIEDVALEVELRTKSLRHYSFNEAAVTHRNTMAGATVGFEAPVIYVDVASAQQTNKLVELAIERQEATQAFYTIQRGPGATVEGDFHKFLTCCFSGDCGVGDQALLDDNAWVGIEMYSNETSTFPMSGSCASGFVRLVQNLKDKSVWRLVIGSPNAGIRFHQFDVDPRFEVTSGLTQGDGHIATIETDPFTRTVRAHVDGSMRVQVSGDDNYPHGLYFANPVAGFNMNTGLVLYTGAMLGATTFNAMWQGCSVINLRVDTVGSGLV